METVAAEFARRFSHWGLCLPPADVASMRPGFIARDGWLVQYLFDKDERGRYLDFYAAHRMTNDAHVRIYEDLCELALPALSSMRIGGTTSEEDQRLQEEHDRRNAEVVEMLLGKGFDRFSFQMKIAAGLIGGSEFRHLHE